MQTPGSLAISCLCRIICIYFALRKKMGSKSSIGFRFGNGSCAEPFLRLRGSNLGGFTIGLRKSDDYEARLTYVLNNPVRAQLVSTAEDWMFQGKLNDLLWW
jgi:hypothetical protein